MENQKNEKKKSFKVSKSEKWNVVLCTFCNITSTVKSAMSLPVSVYWIEILVGVTGLYCLSLLSIWLKTYINCIFIYLAPPELYKCRCWSVCDACNHFVIFDGLIDQWIDFIDILINIFQLFNFFSLIFSSKNNLPDFLALLEL